MLYWDYIDASLSEKRGMDRKLRRGRKPLESQREDRCRKRGLHKQALGRHITKTCPAVQHTSSMTALRSSSETEFHLPMLGSPPADDKWRTEKKCCGPHMSVAMVDPENSGLKERVSTAPALRASSSLPNFLTRLDSKAVTWRL